VTDKQARAIAFLCSAAKTKGYTCEVVHEPRDAREGARVRVQRNDKEWDEIGIPPYGGAVPVTASPGYYGKDTDRFFKFTRTLRNQTRKLK
jgi:hypothetical protein